MLLSIAMIVKNEEKNLENTLKSVTMLKGKIDCEIVIVDTGSSDRTIEIAKKYTDKVYFHSWENDFSKARNESILKCKGKWILILDADEFVEDYKDIVEFFEREDHDKYKCATVICKNPLTRKGNEYSMCNILRLFKNDKDFIYTGKVHEQPNVTKPVTTTNIKIIHSGYDNNDCRLMNYKYKRNKELLLSELEKGHNKIYTNFQLSQCMYMANLDKEGFCYLSTSYKLLTESINKEIYLFIYQMLAQKLMEKKKYNSAINVLLEAVEINNNIIDFHSYLAKAYEGIKNYRKAEKHYNKYFELYEKINSGEILEQGNVVNYTFSSREKMALSYFLMDYKNRDFNTTEQMYINLLNSDEKEKVISPYLYMLIKYEKYSKINEVLKSKNISDELIEIIIDVIQEISLDEPIRDIKKTFEKIKDIDIRLEYYYKLIYMDNEVDGNYFESMKRTLNWDEFHDFKGELIRSLIHKDFNIEDIIHELNDQDFTRYIEYIKNDYKCNEKLYEYSLTNILNSDLKTQNRIMEINKLLLVNENIYKEYYKELIMVTIINKVNYLNNIYKKNILNDKMVYKSILKDDEIICLELNNNFKLYQKNKLKYISNLKELVVEYGEYKLIVEILLEDIDDSIITEEMLLEKQNILQIIASYIENSKLDEAENVLLELNKTFKYDSKIFNYLGIIEYLKGNYDKSIRHLAFAQCIDENNYDINYNLACVFEAKNDMEMAKKFHNKAIQINENL